MEILLLLIGLGTGLALGFLWAKSRPYAAADAALAALETRVANDAVVKEGLERLADQMRELEHNRATWQGQLRQQVESVRHTAEGLRRETSALATALRKPQVRGRWGEMQLRRAVELAGMVERCDFSEQSHLAIEERALRPDMVVHLSGGRHVVIDSKVPLDAFLDLTAAEGPDEQAAHLARHARQLRTHVDLLSSKRYWRALTETPEFVVLFLPGESFLSAALDGDGALIEYAADRKVVLATPTTLIALLRTVAHGWTQEALAAKARDIHRLGRELHERLATMSGHLDKVGRSLTAAVGAYNQAVGSLEARVLVSARRLSELEVAPDDLPAPQPVEVAPRRPSAAELVEDERSGVASGGEPPLGVASDTPA
jgi:DNA recombination protein RmuC